VLIVVIALRLLELGPSGVGALTAAVGVGGVIGGALVFVRLRRARHGADLALGLLLWGIPLIVLALNSSEAAALVLLGVVGVGVTVVDVSTVTLLQRSATDESLSHALGLLQTVFVIGIAAGTVLAPLLVSSLGVRGAVLITGGLLPLLAAALWPRVRRLDSREPTNPALVALLETIPIFEPMPQAALEHLANELEPTRVAAGEAVFDQGDRGDTFYVIQEGTVDVIQDGVVVATLGGGGYFGEIALLRDVPRTATVVSRTDAQLFRLDRAPFLATVTGNATSSRNANAIVADRLGLRGGLASL
jgi:MFS family permease